MPPTNELPHPRILIVDDQQANINLLELTLRRAGFEGLESTTHPRTAAGLHQANHYDLILLDIQMPEMSGIEVLQELKEIRETHPVLVLVISADPGQKTMALAGGADGFIEKPFRLSDVVDRMMLLLDGSPSG